MSGLLSAALSGGTTAGDGAVRIRGFSLTPLADCVGPEQSRLSTGLNGGVYPTQVAEWAGHSVDVLLRIYATCIVGQDELAKRRISEALRHG
jgi:hypothetical protein